jgi:Toastrack DUF4097
MRNVGVIFILLVTAAMFAMPGRAADAVFDRTFPLPPGGSFELENVNGPITITGWDRAAVEVHAVKMTRQEAAELARVRIDVEKRPGGISVATVYPHDAGVEVSVAYHIQVPRRVLLRQVETVNGTVRASGVDAIGTLQSVNGDVEVLDSSGGLSARTTNGNVRMELLRLNPAGPLTLDTVNGSIALSLPADAGVALHVHSLNGDFRSELPLSRTGAYNPREFRGSLGDGRVAVTLETVNGKIRLLALDQGI